MVPKPRRIQVSLIPQDFKFNICRPRPRAALFSLLPFLISICIVRSFCSSVNYTCNSFTSRIHVQYSIFTTADDKANRVTSNVIIDTTTLYRVFLIPCLMTCYFAHMMMKSSHYEFHVSLLLFLHVDYRYG